MTLPVIAAIAVCVSLVASPVTAKQFDIPSANPAVTVDVPSSWKPNEEDTFVEATSPDGETYIAFETATAKKMEKLIDDDIAFLTKSGVTIDRSTQQTQDSQVNGIPVSFLHWKGRDKDGPTSVTLGIFGVSNNLIVLMTAWSSPAGDKSQGAALDRILASVTRR